MNSLAMLAGIEIRVSPFLDKAVYRQAKPHHKRRIAKKWRKRYGMKIDHMEPLAQYQVGNVMYVGPTLYLQIKKQIPPVET